MRYLLLIYQNENDRAKMDGGWSLMWPCIAGSA